MRALLVAAVLALALPAGAVAKIKPYIPSGNSSADEYVEGVPTAGGSRPIGSVLHSGGAGSPLAPATASALVGSGPDGRAVVAFAKATAPATVRRRHRSVPGQSAGIVALGGASSDQGAPTGGAPAGAVLQAIFGIGQGFTLPLILVAIVLAVSAWRVWRRRAT